MDGTQTLVGQWDKINSKMDGVERSKKGRLVHALKYDQERVWREAGSVGAIDEFCCSIPAWLKRESK